MADRLGVSQATISRAESGARLLTLPLTRAWLDAVHADEPTRNTVLALAEASHSETVAYRLQLRTQVHLQDHVTNLEAETRRLCAVDSITVHGLLQVPRVRRIDQGAGRHRPDDRPDRGSRSSAGASTATRR